MAISLPKNFVSIAGSDFAVASALQRFARFVGAHPQWDSIDFRAVARELPEIEPALLVRAIGLLVDRGILRQVYSVTTPSGSLTEEKFDRPTDVPEKLADRYQEYFDTADQDIVPVLVAVKR
jgi:hypothetical protein